MIYKYKNNVFTHGGQTSVDGFGIEIMQNKNDIAAVNDLVVYAGYHGDSNGEWVQDFNKEEIAKTQEIANQFSNVELILKFGSGLSEEEIKAAVNNGNVFFTWCDSDRKVKNVMAWE